MTAIRLLAYGVFTCYAFGVFAATIVVDKTTDENDGNCLERDCSLRDAINLSSNGDDITLLAATYNFTLDQIILNTAKIIIINGSGKTTVVIDLTVNGNRLIALDNSVHINFNDLKIQNFTTGHPGYGKSLLNFKTFKC